MSAPLRVILHIEKRHFRHSLLRLFKMYKSQFIFTADFSSALSWTKTREVSIVKWRGRSRDRGHLLHRTGSAGCCSKQKHALWRKLQPGSSFFRIIQCDWPVLWIPAVITNILYTFKTLVFRAIEWWLDSVWPTWKCETLLLAKRGRARHFVWKLDDSEKRQADVQPGFKRLKRSDSRC